MTRSMWRRLVAKELAAHGESWADVLVCTMTDADLDAEFFSGFGGNYEPCSMTAWTGTRVYYNAGYDGASWCETVARHPA